VLSAAVPVATARFFRERVGQEDALERVTGDDELLHALEIPARLLFGVRRGARGERFEIRVAAAARVA
jgi:hypothetical protein